MLSSFQNPGSASSLAAGDSLF